MAKNVEINIKNSSGYDVLWPKTGLDNVEGVKDWVNTNINNIVNPIKKTIANEWSLLDTIEFTNDISLPKSQLTSFYIPSISENSDVCLRFTLNFNQNNNTQSIFSIGLWPLEASIGSYDNTIKPSTGSRIRSEIYFINTGIKLYSFSGLDSNPGWTKATYRYFLTNMEFANSYGLAYFYTDGVTKTEFKLRNNTNYSSLNLVLTRGSKIEVFIRNGALITNIP